LITIINYVGEKMAGISKLLDEASQKRAKAELKALGGRGEVANKLKAIIAVKDHGVSQIAKIFNVTRMTLTNWVKAFNNSDPSSLVAKQKNPRDSKISNERMKIIEQWIITDSSMTIRKLCQRILDDFEVVVSMSTAHRVMQRLKFAFITPRPRHYKQDPQSQTEFKKKSTRASKI
jgi:transposase